MLQIFKNNGVAKQIGDLVLICVKLLIIYIEKSEREGKVGEIINATEIKFNDGNILTIYTLIQNS